MKAALIETRALTLAAAGVTLVGALDWRAAVGERWCVIGRNAAGKSTLLRALAGIGEAGLQPAGEVRWLGRPAVDWPAADAASVRAFLPQHASDRFPITVQRLLEISLVRPLHEVRGLLAALDALALADRNVLELSGGERQRVALAQCAVQGAPLLLLDEPVSFLDLRYQVELFDRVRDLAAEGRAVLAVLHDLNLAAEYCDRVVLLKRGRVITQGPTAEALSYIHLKAAYETEIYVDLNDLTGGLVVTPLSGRAQARLAAARAGQPGRKP